MEAKNVSKVVLNSGKKMSTIGFRKGTITPPETLLDMPLTLATDILILLLSIILKNL
jgi:hypothetical protein